MYPMYMLRGIASAMGTRTHRRRILFIYNIFLPMWYRRVWICIPCICYMVLHHNAHACVKIQTPNLIFIYLCQCNMVPVLISARLNMYTMCMLHGMVSALGTRTHRRQILFTCSCQCNTGTSGYVYHVYATWDCLSNGHAYTQTPNIMYMFLPM